jgi:hypothetical protein
MGIGWANADYSSAAEGDREDGTAWTSKGTYSSKKGTEYQYFEFSDPQQARHVKVECKAPSLAGQKNVSIYELGVYTRY